MSRQRGGDRRHDPDAPGLRQRVRYRFDNLLARGTSATLIWLAVVTLAAVLISSLLLALGDVSLSGSEDRAWLEDAWQSLLRLLDPGTMANDVGWGRRVLALLVTIFGILIAGTLIGIIAAGVEGRIEGMRRGRSVVIESDHIVVLGDSERLPMVLRQLSIAATEGGADTIVVLADRDPGELHHAVRKSTPHHPGVRIVFRAGDPTIPADLRLVRLPAARAAVVLSDRCSDVAAVETVLAMAAERGGLDDFVVIVELLEQSTAERLRRAYGASVHPIVTSEAVARMSAHSLRQRGLSTVVDELVDFRGADLQVLAPARFAGWAFGELVAALVNARPIGVIGPDGDVRLCPSADHVVGDDECVIAIADDPAQIEVIDRDQVRAVRAVHDPPVGAGPVEEHLVVIGWSDLGDCLLTGWAQSAAASSDVVVLVGAERLAAVTDQLPDLGAIAVEVRPASDPIACAAELEPTTVVLLTPPAESDDAADVDTLLDLRALGRLLARRGQETPRVVLELRDAAHADLVELPGADDLVISDALGSQFLAQLVDQPLRRDILLTLYAGDRASLRLVPCEQFELVGEWQVDQVVARAAAFGLLAVGWRRSVDRGGEVALNPRLDSVVRLDDGDSLVVIGGHTR